MGLGVFLLFNTFPASNVVTPGLVRDRLPVVLNRGQVLGDVHCTCPAGLRNNTEGGVPRGAPGEPDRPYTGGMPMDVLATEERNSGSRVQSSFAAPKRLDLPRRGKPFMFFSGMGACWRSARSRRVFVIRRVTVTMVSISSFLWIQWKRSQSQVGLTPLDRARITMNKKPTPAGIAVYIHRRNIIDAHLSIRCNIIFWGSREEARNTGIPASDAFGARAIADCGCWKRCTNMEL